MKPSDQLTKWALNRHLMQISEALGGVDVMSITGPLYPGMDARVRSALEGLSGQEEKSEKIAIVLHTPGGVVEVVERMVGSIRYFYQEVLVIVPDSAMSAGTVLALSADDIMMDYYSQLGPIDPQIVKNGNLVPALAYIKQYERLNEKAEENNLTAAEYAMLQQIDIAELYIFEQARQLSVQLLKNWLSQYKFKNWEITEGEKKKVTARMKKKRAEEIATQLSDTERWCSHGRGIDINTLTGELKLKIEDYSRDKKLYAATRDYFDLLMDYLEKNQISFFVHTKEYF